MLKKKINSEAEEVVMKKKLITTQHWLTQKLGLGSTIKVRVRVYHELGQRLEWKRENDTLMKVI
jgi:predicted transcriptional regulator